MRPHRLGPIAGDYLLGPIVVLLLVIGLYLPAAGELSESEPEIAAPAVVRSDSRGLTVGHRRMLEILQQIKERAPEEHQYFGQKNHLKNREELKQLSPNARSKRFNVLAELGLDELLFDDNELAIEHLLEAYDLLDQARFRDRKIKLQWTFRVKLHLAVAYLRLGETQNCCLRYTAESCIVPIRGDGVHTSQEGSRQAMKYFLELLKDTSKGTDTDQKLLLMKLYYYGTARWLLNIAAMTIGGYPDQVPAEYRIPAKFFESEIPFPRFKNVGPKLGLDTFSAAGGVIVDDFDNDNHLDIFTSTSDPTGQTQYFRNNCDGTFTERTEEAGLVGLYGGLNMVQADYNNDGNLDVFILRGAWHGKRGRHPNSLLCNNGDGTFTDVTFEAGLGEAHYPTKTAGWADYDNDGDLDLFVANETSSESSSETTTRDVTTAIHAPWQLFRNQGDGTFTDIAKDAGVGLAKFGMGTVWGDYDHDRFPDLFVTAGPGSHMFHNNGDGTFTDVTQQLNLTRPWRPFPVWFWDFDNDGVLDLYISSTSGNVGTLALNAVGRQVSSPRPGFARSETDWGKLSFELPGLYRGDGRGGFIDVAQEMNLEYPTEPMGANFGDLNGDGYLDFYLATGDIAFWELRPNVMFLNQQGQRFVNVTMAGGFGHLQKGHGVSFADIDNDGDQDVYVQMGGQYPADRYIDALFENPGFGHHWITVKLVGQESNRSAIGARIQLVVIEDGKERSIYRHVNSGGSFGCNPLRQNMGLGLAEKIDRMEIYWPTTGQTEIFCDVTKDQTIEIVEGENRFTRIHVKPFVLGSRE